MIEIEVIKSDQKLIEMLTNIFPITETREFKKWESGEEIVHLKLPADVFLTIVNSDSVKNILDNLRDEDNPNLKVKWHGFQLSFIHDRENSIEILKTFIKVKKERKEIKKKTAFDMVREYISKNEHNDSKLDIDLDIVNLSVEMLHAYEYDIAEYNNKNLLLIDTSKDVELATKKALFLPSSTAISFASNTVSMIHHHDGSDPDIYTGEPGGTLEYYCPLLKKGEDGVHWFSKVKPLLYNGLLEYIPNITVFEEKHDGTCARIDDYVVRTSEGSLDISTEEINDTKIDPRCLSIDIPFLHNIPLLDFSEIAVEHGDSFEAFRLFFQKNINNIDFEKVREKTDFELSLQDSVRKINNAISTEFGKLEKNVMIGLLTTTIAVSLYVFNNSQELINSLLGIGGGAGLVKFFSDAYDYQIERHNISNSDCYFLWILKKQGIKQEKKRRK